MKNKLIVITAALLASAVAFAKPAAKKDKKAKQAEPEVVLATKVDTASYAMGVAIGQQMLENLEKGNYNKGVYAKAFCDVIFGNPTLMNSDSATRYMMHYVSEMKKEAVRKNQEESAKFLEENAKREGVVTTASGLQYQVVKMGDGEKPNANSKVTVNYEGFLVDGTKFDSSIDRGEPTSFALNAVIQGWSEALQLMPVGSKFTLYLPYQLAYGERGAGDVIPPYSTLIFEVELISIDK